jgi:hypothetical protein
MAVLAPYESQVDPGLVRDTLMANAAMRHLVSGHGNPAIADQLQTFGQFVGSWDAEMVVIGPDDENSTKYIAEWHFGWALHGAAIQDVLITRTADGGLIGYGTTVRTFDDRDGTWWIVWQDPRAHEFAVLYARPVGDRIELDGQWPVGKARFRWVFSSITPSSFHWEGLLSEDDGQSWRVAETIDAIRRAP